MDKIDVKIKGHFFENGGYAKVNRNLALGLESLGVNVKIEPVNKPSIKDPELKSLLRKSFKNEICIDSIVPTSGHESFGKYKILYTTIESDTLPDFFVDFTKNYNEIWVTSDFCKRILEKYNIKSPIYVIPDSIDHKIYKEDGNKYSFSSELNPFVFISVFGWSYRKGYDVLLKSYLQEFNEDDPVSLLIVSKSKNQKDIIRKTIDKYIKEYGGGKPPHIVRYNKDIEEKTLPDIYRACNAFVLFSRGEGFLIPSCEASLCGLPVICTNYSGQTMFLNKYNSYLLDIDKLADIKQGTMHVSYWDNLKMASLKDPEIIKNAGTLMRLTLDNYKIAKNKNSLLQKYILENFTINKVSNKAYDRLKKIKENLI